MKQIIYFTANGLLGSSFLSKCTSIMFDGGSPIDAPVQFQKDLACVTLDGHGTISSAAYYISDEEDFDEVMNKKVKIMWFRWSKAHIYSTSNGIHQDRDVYYNQQR